MILKGVQVMIIGMGVVFIFLMLMVWVMQLAGSLFQKFANPQEDDVKIAAEPNNEIQEIAVAIAAIQEQNK